MIADQNSGKKIREYINQIYEVPIGTKIDVSIMDQLLGSADAIRHVKDKIKASILFASLNLD